MIDLRKMMNTIEMYWTGERWRFYCADPDSERRSCYDCKHLSGVISLWCTNEECVEWRGSRIPGGIGCPFWEPQPPPPTRLPSRLQRLVRSLKFW